MKAVMKLMLGSVLVLALAAAAAAQSPTPVVRMGDWVEIGDEVWMNVISANTIRYATGHNWDLEGDIRDLTASGSVTSSGNKFSGKADSFFAEIRLGADFRFQKNLRMRVLLEADSVFDGSLIDDQVNNPTDGGRNSVHVERFWIDYRLPKTSLRMRVGADLWCLDIACVVSDDDPGIKFFYNAGDFEARTFIIVNQESAKLNNLTNDNDNIYYMLGGRYTGMKGHTFALDFLYDRDRFNQIAAGRESDFYLFMPGWRGRFGPVSGFVEGLFGFGEVRTPDRDFDVANWAILFGGELKIGKVTPFLGVIYASGDDNANDTDLNGFNPVNHSDVHLISLGPFPDQDAPFYDLLAPCVGNSPLCGGAAGMHTITNPFANAVGNTQHAGLDSEFSNPGIFTVMVGASVALHRQHRLDLWYNYVRWADSALIENQARAMPGVAADFTIDESMYHNLGAKWTWTLNAHFNVQFTGNMVLAGAGMKDIASTVDCGGGGLEPGSLGFRGCSGDDVGLAGEIQFTGSF